MNAAPCEHDRREARIGAACGVGAYLWWGFAAIYFKATLPLAFALEIVAHRVVWCVVLLAGLVTVRRRWRTVRAIVATRRTMIALCTSAALIGGNWFLFIHAIETDRLIQASLGYFINPLLSVLLGFIVLRERLRAGQWAGVVLAAVAVIYLTIGQGEFPTLALGMALSFGFYGLIRKVARVDAVNGLLIETALLLPFAAGYLLHLSGESTGHFLTGARVSVLLLLAGPVTAVPLLLFVASARRLRLVTVGFLQYLAPTGQFLLAVLVYGEALDVSMVVAFIGIWVALVVYSLDALRAQTSPVGR